MNETRNGTIRATINGAETISETLSETINRSLDRFAELERVELVVLGYLSTHPRATYEEVSSATEFSRAKVGRIISELRGSNVLIREG